MPHGLVWLKVIGGNQAVPELGEFVPAFNDDSEIDVIRSAMNRQVIDILQQKISRFRADDE